MSYRDDLDAAHARVRALELELATAKRDQRGGLRCEKCLAEFEPGDLSHRGALTCRQCARSVEVAKPQPRRPGGVDVDESAERLRVAWLWRISFLDFFGFLAAAFLVIGALVKDHHGRVPGIIVVGVIVLGPIALFGGYRVLGQLFNRTVVEVTAKRLVVASGPIAIRGRKVLDAGDIDQIYCVLHHAKYSVWYSVEARLRGGRTETLVDDVADAERAFYLEAEIERRMSVVDRPVQGEVARRPADAG